METVFLINRFIRFVMRVLYQFFADNEKGQTFSVCPGNEWIY